MMERGGNIPGVCRCCLAVGRFRQLGRSYSWLGNDEHYATMLNSCFNIAIAQGNDGAGEALICAVCVTQLRDAYNFRRQVERSQARYADVLRACGGRSINRLLTEQRVKQEFVEVVELDNAFDDVEPDPEYLYEAKETDEVAGETSEVAHLDEDLQELEGEDHGHGRAEADIMSSADDFIIAIEVTEDGDASEQREHFQLETAPAAPEPKPLRSSVKRRRSDDDYVPSGRARKRKAKPRVQSARGPKRVTERSVKITEEDCLRRNAATIIANSEVCPFKCLYNVYRCFYCAMEFDDPADLRSHSALDHPLDKYDAHVYMQSDANVTIDVTDLNCALCEERFKDLNELVSHLGNAHEINLNLKYGTGVTPFKLTKNPIACCMCKKRFYTFHMLSMHMNEHLSAFACDLCGSAFITRVRLDKHYTTHAAGSYQCAACKKTFATRTKLTAHVQCVHNKIKKLICRLCDARFANYEQKVHHQVKVHDQEPMQYKCQFCDKVFTLRRLLMNHHRRDHLQVRNHRCGFCGKSFYLKSQYDNHVVVHTGVKSYECDVCEKKFNRKGNLAVHLAVHTGIRSHVCGICSCSFITSSHLSWHKKKMHSDNVIYF